MDSSPAEEPVCSLHTHDEVDPLLRALIDMEWTMGAECPHCAEMLPVTASQVVDLIRLVDNDERRRRIMGVLLRHYPLRGLPSGWYCGCGATSNDGMFIEHLAERLLDAVSLTGEGLPRAADTP